MGSPGRLLGGDCRVGFSKGGGSLPGKEQISKFRDLDLSLK